MQAGRVCVLQPRCVDIGHALGHSSALRRSRFRGVAGFHDGRCGFAVAIALGISPGAGPRQ